MKARSVPLLLAILMTTLAFAGDYAWQKPQAKVLPNGDLQWAPEPFEYQPGKVVRYIDFQGGNDANPGTKAQPWKHHPWDTQATGKAAEASGVDTYVFKGGVMYRGTLNAAESGKPGRPIRLTADPSWGEGMPWIVGSIRLADKWVPASRVDAPSHLPEPEKVYALDLKALGMTAEDDGRHRVLSRLSHADRMGRVSTPWHGLFIIGPEGSVTRAHLARDPNWQRPNSQFAMEHWHQWKGMVQVQDTQGNRYSIPQADYFKDKPQGYFTGGYIWSQYPSFMGTPTPKHIPETKPAKKNIGEMPYHRPEVGGLSVGLPGGVARGVRFMVENLPQLLDSANEFYYDETTGLLLFRPEEGVDPNSLHMEFVASTGLVHIREVKHIELSGLRFAFAEGRTIQIQNLASDITITNCYFHDLTEVAIDAYIKGNAEVGGFEDLRVTDCRFENIWETAIRMSGGNQGIQEWVDSRGRLGRVEILRNYCYETGMRHRGALQSNVPTISLRHVALAHVAGNIIHRSFGSGIVLFGGKEGNLGTYRGRGGQIPLIRIFVHHNKTLHTAMGVNDYGGLALWQGGPMYAYCNNVGSSVGYMPGGITMFGGGGKPTTLSYPVYLDGAYKIYLFNNAVWGATTDESHPYHTRTSGYFMVFGFLNQFTNNTIYRARSGVGGSSGNRCDVISNVFSEISTKFLHNNRFGDPSLVGGGDDATSGVKGVPSLAFADNIFHGQAEGGELLKQRYDQQNQPRLNIANEIKAPTIQQLAEQMQNYPIRFGRLGRSVEQRPIVGSDAAVIEEASEVDFRLRDNSAARDNGSIYFVPFSLYATVGEWHFTENRASPDVVVDYHWYFSEAHLHRSMYEQVPAFDLKLSATQLDDYVPSPWETWAKGAIRFDGKRFGSVSDREMREDFVFTTDNPRRTRRYMKGKKEGFWKVSVEGRKHTYTLPAEKRQTLNVGASNLLLEAQVKVKAGHVGGAIVSKFDGKTGYQLDIDSSGKARFLLAGKGRLSTLASKAAINDGRWHHILAEVDRSSGKMTVYIDGKVSSKGQCALGDGVSLDNTVDFQIGKGSESGSLFVGDIDFLRVCKGTLADSRTDIDELYQWQTNGPWKFDMAGQTPAGPRDAGALESPR